jgi:SAM-dependent methyltransferase
MSAASVFRCLVCHGGALEPKSAGFVCLRCGCTYPTERGVPVLVRDPSAHTAAIEQARQVNPAWYEAEQLLELASPWRHHLKKRRLYVESVLQRELARRGWRKAPRVLDLGCGDGNNLLWLAAFAEDLYGSDFNMVRVARAKTRSPAATLFLADVLDYPATDGAFDVVFFNHVIEHIPDDASALATVRRILAPGGLLILGTPNEGAWWWQLAYRRAPEALATTDHVHFYTAETISAKMQEAQLDVFEVKHMGWGPPDWRLDGLWRRHKIVDDLFECIGRLLIPRQASSLYLLATK